MDITFISVIMGLTAESVVFQQVLLRPLTIVIGVQAIKDLTLTMVPSSKHGTFPRIAWS